MFHLSSRQSEGLLRSLFALMKLDNDVPDHTTTSRRKPKLGKVPFYPVLCQNLAVIRKKENRPEAADYGRSNPRNQRRLDFLRSTGRLEMVSVFMGSDSATKMEISADRVW